MRRGLVPPILPKLPADTATPLLLLLLLQPGVSVVAGVASQFNISANVDIGLTRSPVEVSTGDTDTLFHTLAHVRFVWESRPTGEPVALTTISDWKNAETEFENTSGGGGCGSSLTELGTSVQYQGPATGSESVCTSKLSLSLPAEIHK